MPLGQIPVAAATQRPSTAIGPRTTVASVVTTVAASGSSTGISCGVLLESCLEHSEFSALMLDTSTPSPSSPGTSGVGRSSYSGRVGVGGVGGVAQDLMWILLHHLNTQKSFEVVSSMFRIVTLLLASEVSTHDTHTRHAHFKYTRLHVPSSMNGSPLALPRIYVLISSSRHQQHHYQQQQHR